MNWVSRLKYLSLWLIYSYLFSKLRRIKLRILLNCILIIYEFDKDQLHIFQSFEKLVSLVLIPLSMSF